MGCALSRPRRNRVSRASQHDCVAISKYLHALAVEQEPAVQVGLDGARIPVADAEAGPCKDLPECGRGRRDAEPER